MDPPTKPIDRPGTKEGFDYDGFAVLGSCDDLQFVLTQYSTCVRFVLVLARPEEPEKGDVLAKWFAKLDQSEDDPDEMAHDDCLGELRDQAISVCRDQISTLMSSLPATTIRQRQSLEWFLYPTTFCLQLVSEGGALAVQRLYDTTRYVRQLEPTTLPRDSWSPSISSPVPASDIDFIEDLSMGQVIKVSRNSQVCVFKSAHYGARTQLTREINTLHRVMERWPPSHPAPPAVPQFRGLVGLRGQVIGFLEDHIEGNRLSEMDLAQWPITQRREWRRRIEQTITLLHQHGFIWGDVKADNILIERDTKRPRLIDFGGSFTPGWVDEHLAETKEGDMQGLRQLVKYLDLRR